MGRLTANAWGLYDMHGNVSAHCAGGYDTRAAKSGKDPSSKAFVRRGGSWDSRPEDCRCASRKPVQPDSRAGDVGFRVALDPQ